MKFLLFAAAMACLMLAMHWAVFRSAMHFFHISRPAVKYLLYAFMALLSFSFISAFVLIHWQENQWTIAYYRFAAVWTGFVIHSLTAAAAAWLLLGAARLLGLPVSSRLIGTAMLGLALVLSVYGFWAAFHPKVREVTVPVASLPENWKNSTIVLLSDIHLGHMHGRGFSRRVVETVNRLNPDLVLITGDLVDGMGGPYEDNLKPLNHLQAKHGIFFVTGNHEHYVGIEKSLSLIGKTPLHILDNEVTEITGLELVGVSYPGIASVADIRSLSRSRKPGRVRIVMFHTPTEMGTRASGARNHHLANYWTPDTGFAINQQLHADLQVSGHTHHGQLFPLQFLTRLLYRNHDSGLKKINPGFHLYTTAGTGSWGPPMRTAGRPEITLIRLAKTTLQ